MGEHLNLLKHFSYKEQVARSISWGHYFIFLNILLACFESFAYVYAAPPIQGVLSLVYMIVAWLGHMSFLTVVAYLVIFFPLAFIGNFRYYRVFAVIVASLLHTILLFDIKIFLMVKVHLGITALNLIVRELDFDTGLNYNFLLIAIPLVVIFELIFAKLTTHSLYKAHHTLLVRSVFSVLVACFVSSHVMHIWADAVKYEPITVLRSTLPAHYPMTARSFLSSHGWLSEDQLKAEDSLLVSYPLSPIVSEPDEHPYNILLLAVNGLSYSNLSVELTPNLLKIKQQAQSFDQHYLLYDDDLSNIFSMTYGLPLQYRSTLVSQSKSPVIVDEMFKQDFMPRVILSTPELQHGNAASLGKENFALHVQNVLSQVGLRPVQLIRQTSDHAALQQIERLFDEYSSANSQRPFAMMVLLNDLMYAQQMQSADKEDLAADKNPAMRALSKYEQALSQIDQLLGRTFENLKSKNQLEHTVVIVTSLSGDPLMSQGKAFNRQKQHVPLFVLWPDRTGIGSSVNNLSSPQDIVATLAREVLRITTSSGNFTLGDNLKNLPDREYLIADSDDSQLVLIGRQDIIIYSHDGSSYAERDGRQLQVRPNLENLIRSTRDINRFLR